jgi:hypothetical protein
LAFKTRRCKSTKVWLLTQSTKPLTDYSNGGCRWCACVPATSGLCVCVFVPFFFQGAFKVVRCCESVCKASWPIETRHRARGLSPVPTGARVACTVCRLIRCVCSKRKPRTSLHRFARGFCSTLMICAWTAAIHMLEPCQLVPPSVSMLVP